MISYVLILVVMEDALALALTSVFSLKQEVLILVVMEDALALFRFGGCGVYLLS